MLPVPPSSLHVWSVRHSLSFLFWVTAFYCFHVNLVGDDLKLLATDRPVDAIFDGLVVFCIATCRRGGVVKAAAVGLVRLFI